MMGLDREKLRILLNYWVMHNRKHTEDLKSWAERTRELDREVSERMLEAGRKMEEINEPLLEALERLSHMGEKNA